MLARLGEEEKVPRKRALGMFLLAGLAVLLVALGLGAQRLIAYAHVGTTYVAEQVCSCRHVSGRALDSCMNDHPRDARSQISVIEDGDRVGTSAFFGVFGAEAVHEGGYGCRIVTN